METSNVQIKTASTQNPDERKCSVTTDNKAVKKLMEIKMWSLVLVSYVPLSKSVFIYFLH